MKGKAILAFSAPSSPPPPSPQGTNVRDEAGLAPRVCLFENHDQSYHIWRAEGLRDRVVLHLDLHDDLAWIKPDQPIHIGNYLCFALREGIARETIWVVPDGSFASLAARHRLLQRVRHLVRQYPAPRAKVRSDAGGISAALLGKPLLVVPLSSLPPLREPVLLDIDVDFLTSQSALPPELAPQDLPWCWPGELVQLLATRGVQADLATIAWSVEGGYTPLRWKCLGDELKDRLQHIDSESISSAEKLREAAVCRQRGDTAAAESKLRETLLHMGPLAAPCYHLALLLRSAGRQEEAGTYYRRALELDPTYATAYNNRGPIYWRWRRFALAEQEYREALSLHENDAYAHFGLAQVLFHRRRWGQAEAALRRALESNAHLPDAWSLLGDVLARQGRQTEAITAYDRFLRLTLLGKYTLRSLQMTERRGLLDVGHASTHAKIARIQETMGDLRQAAQGYRISIAANRDRAVTRFRLARVLARRGKWGGAIRHFVTGLGRIPADLRRRMVTLWWRSRRDG